MNTSQLLSAIEEEVKTSFELDGIRGMTFESFFNEVDCQNAFEEEWKAEYYKPFYFVVFNKIKKGEIR